MAGTWFLSTMRGHFFFFLLHHNLGDGTLAVGGELHDVSTGLGGKEGVLNAYRKTFVDEYDNTDLRLHFILFANDQTCMDRLDNYCKKSFYNHVDKYRHDIEAKGEDVKQVYEKIVKAHASTSPFYLT